MRILVVTIIIFVVSNTIRNRWALNNNSTKYTKGLIFDVGKGATVGPWFEYEYIVEGESIKSKHGIGSSLAKESLADLSRFIGRSFVVRYVESRPHVNELLLNLPLSDACSRPPKNGWESIPNHCIEER